MTSPIATMKAPSPRPHMIAPDSCWSASAEMPKNGVRARYVGQSTTPALRMLTASQLIVGIWLSR
jgi:hypothetical protein